MVLLARLERISQGLESLDNPPVAHVSAQDDAAAFVGVRRRSFPSNLLKLRGSKNKRAHGQVSASAASSRQKSSDMYLAAESQKIVTTTPSFNFDATFSAATKLAPELTPTISPSSRARRRTIRCASSVETSIWSSATIGS